MEAIAAEIKLAAPRGEPRTCETPGLIYMSYDPGGLRWLGKRFMRRRAVPATAPSAV